MRRREFITLLGGAAVAWPLAARAQQTEQTRRIGVLIGIGQDDLGGQARYAAFLQALQQLGWSEGRNMRIETRWAAGDANRLRKHADELVALAPDVILTVGSVSVGQRSSAYPVPYALETDWPVGEGGLEPPHQESSRHPFSWGGARGALARRAPHGSP
jgi:putative tryptophan/tyrosine transport system substrate-binding protein